MEEIYKYGSMVKRKNRKVEQEATFFSPTVTLAERTRCTIARICNRPSLCRTRNLTSKKKNTNLKQQGTQAKHERANRGEKLHDQDKSSGQDSLYNCLFAPSAHTFIYRTPQKVLHTLCGNGRNPGG